RPIRKRALLRSNRAERAVHQPADGDLFRLRAPRAGEAVALSPFARGDRVDLRRGRPDPSLPAHHPTPPAGPHPALTRHPGTLEEIMSDAGQTTVLFRPVGEEESRADTRLGLSRLSASLARAADLLSGHRRGLRGRDSARLEHRRRWDRPGFCGEADGRTAE